MRSVRISRLLTAILASAAIVSYHEICNSVTPTEPGKLRDAWLKFESCREAAVAKDQEALLERCLSAALPRSVSLLEKQKAAQFLSLEIKPKEIFECPRSLIEARGKKAEKEARDNGLRYGCFEIKLSGPAIKGEIEFSPEAASDATDTYRVRKIRYGF
ncbi:MAG: hypothetical protein U1E10_10340 [Bdellovibrionales bacterium]|nr:hypothetical protein [Bdellovibrionales bacterium]